MLSRAEECKQAVMGAFVEAGEILMGMPEFPLRVHGDITYWPDYYLDPDGREIWSIVCKVFRVGFISKRRSSSMSTDNLWRLKPKYQTVCQRCKGYIKVGATIVKEDGHTRYSHRKQKKEDTLAETHH